MKLLLDAGASGAAVNESQQTPYDVVRCARTPDVAILVKASL